MYLTEYKSGLLMKQNPGSLSEYQYFLPEKINHPWKTDDPKISVLLERANIALGKLESYSELIPNMDVYIKMHLRTEANKSNRIEGTQTTIEEDLLPEEDIEPEKRNDHQEVQNYIKAINYGIDQVLAPQNGLPLCNRLLRDIHEVLLQGVRGEYKTPGQFRTSQNWIGGSNINNAVYVPTSPVELPDLMSDFESFMNNDELEIPHLMRIAILHYQFETIHPFLDGNGRIGRLMIPLYLLSKKVLTSPCFYISDFFEKHKLEYYDKLQRARTKNALNDWVCFFLEASIVTAETALTKFKNVVEFVNNNQFNIQKLHKRNTDVIHSILEEFYRCPIQSSSELTATTHHSTPTINSTLNILEKMKLIKEITGYKRHKIYIMDKYIKLYE